MECSVWAMTQHDQSEIPKSGLNIASSSFYTSFLISKDVKDSNFVNPSIGRGKKQVPITWNEGGFVKIAHCILVDDKSQQRPLSLICHINFNATQNFKC